MARGQGRCSASDEAWCRLRCTRWVARQSARERSQRSASQSQLSKNPAPAGVTIRPNRREGRLPPSFIAAWKVCEILFAGCGAACNARVGGTNSSEGWIVTIQEFLKVLRTRWLTIAIVTAIGLLVAVGINSFTTPVYRASTRLFVSANSGTTANDIYQGNRFSQERVLSYADLIVGANLAQRTIDKMNLNMTADDLRARITAVARPNTVLIDVSASDESPSRASDIANTLSDEFVVMARELETPENGLPPDSRVVVEQRASIPKVPVAPAPRRNIAMGFAIGMLLGIVSRLSAISRQHGQRPPSSGGDRWSWNGRKYPT